MEGNAIETTTKQVTIKDQADFPYKARKLFGLLEKDELEEGTICQKNLETVEKD